MKKAGVSVDKTDLDTFFKKIDGQEVQDLVKAGTKKCAVLPSGGARAAGPVAAAGAAEAAPEEEKKEEAEDVDMGGLFGDDDDY